MAAKSFTLDGTFSPELPDMSEKSKFNSPLGILCLGMLLSLSSSIFSSGRVEARSPLPPTSERKERATIEAEETVGERSERDRTPLPSFHSSSLKPDNLSLSSPHLSLGRVLSTLPDAEFDRFPSPPLQRSTHSLDRLQAQRSIPNARQNPLTTAQVPIPQIPPNVPPTPEPPSTTPLPELDPPQLPPPEELLQPGTPTPETPTGEDAPQEIVVERFEIVGSTILSEEDVAELTAPYTNRPISFAELLQVRSLITQYYIDRGYITTGALVPPQELSDGTVQIQVVEGGIEEINVEGTRRLNPGYVTSRLGLAADPPLNIERLREALQLLQLDPLIRNISAELSSGTRTGFNILDVTVTEADTFNFDVVLNNSRSPNVGSFRRGVEVSEANFLGIGDRIAASYFNTDGSNSLDLSYTVPFNPRNGTLRFAFGTSLSRVIDPTFEVLEISSRSRYYELTVRQPVVQTPSQEFALGLTFSRQESQTALGILPDLEGFPISPGADNEGRTKVSALRFFQEWVKRSERQAIALRSQFSLGVDWLDATENPEPPDTNFFSWRGQAQWVRLLAPDALFLLRTDLQFSDRTLLTLEQFGLGGIDSVRGYRQDFLLADNGWFVSAEARIPVLRVPSIDGVLQVAPFVDFGLGWNRAQDSSLDTLAGIGLGLRWNQGDRLQLRLDWGIPLTDVDLTRRTWQDHGLYFSVRYSLF